MASEMPVLPLVGSRMVQPGVRRPSFSACSIMNRAGRSLTEPVGLRSSSLAQMRASGDGDSRGRRTRGVLPTAASGESYRIADQDIPPATAGRIVTLSPSASLVLMPSRKRTSSSFR
ncbi:hypothetical protein SGRIM128S_05533 [Streptomyces griseomycini]